jgi:hypothetical protein
MERQPGQREPQWLTYSEAAERLNVSPHAVRMRANRFGWRKQMGNDGKARVLVSLEPRSPDERPPTTRSSASQKAADPALVEALEAHVETLKATRRRDDRPARAQRHAQGRARPPRR